MYFPNGVARVLSQSPGDEPILSISANPRKSLFLTTTASTISLWRVRPAIHLASLKRTDLSIRSHGHNVMGHWAPNSSRLVIQTSASHLVLVRVDRARTVPYDSSGLGPGTSRRFQPGSGEATPITGHHFVLEGVVGVHGGLIFVSPRLTHILFTTAEPAAVQRIPWPTAPPRDGEDTGESPLPNATKPSDNWLGHDTWFLEQDELPWLVKSDVTITQVTISQSTGYEGWIASDGRAYLVYLYEEDPDEDMNGQGEEETRGRQPPAGGVSPVDADRSSNHSDVSEHLNVAQQHSPGHGLDSSTPSPRTADTRSLVSTSTRARSDESSAPEATLNWEGICIHGSNEPPSSIQVDAGREDLAAENELAPDEKATRMAFNSAFSLISVGTSGGFVHISDLPSSGVTTGQIQTLRPPDTSSSHRVMQSRLRPQGIGAVNTLEWTSDGYALAVGWERGWALYTVGGRCIASSVWYEGEIAEQRFDDAFMNGIIDFIWAPGNLDLIALAARSPHELPTKTPQLFVIPLAKSAVTSQQSPDNTRYGVLQVDGGVMIYRGADQPDMSTINPEADVWQHVKIPSAYIASNWPIRYASISSDGRLLAIAGRAGLLHWSAISGRWKMFANVQQEQAFSVRGGIVWFNHVLVAAVELSGSYGIRLYSRDLELATTNILYREHLTASVVILSLVDNSLLVYTADNTIHHFLILTTQDTVKLRLCGSISFDGIVGQPNAVRGLSWMIPNAQKELGDPINDLAVATVLMLLGGRLILLRPRKVGPHEVKYDMQILHERIEFCWIHLAGIGALENSLWGFDGTSMRIWLDALTIESTTLGENAGADRGIRESVNVPLDFYPVSCLMEKGVIIGVEHEAATRVTLPFVMFRTVTSTHLFLHHVLSYHLRKSQLKEAVTFAANYQSLVFFSHALEILLHTVLESETDAEDALNPLEARTRDLLSLTIEFIDHFESSLEVVVGCARKTEMSRWRRLFDIVGNPKELFEACLQTNQLKTAGSYLLVLHNLEQLDEQHEDAIRLLQRAIDASDWTLSRELLYFLRSIDESGACLGHAMQEVGLVDEETGRSTAQ